MSLDLDPIRRALARGDRVARVVVTAIKGSTPREVGTSMLVWPGGQDGTIGGGALEWEATGAALRALEAGRGTLSQHPLGPDLGQCCGGFVALATEIWDADRLAQAEAARGAFCRPVAGDLPRPDGLGTRPGLELRNGWLAEPMAPAPTPLWVWGAGHVGRAVVQAMASLPGWAIMWADTGPDRFPDTTPSGVTGLWAGELARLMEHAPTRACHLIVTHSHALDLALCSAALHRGFAFCGLIGSATKKARFARRLSELGHAAEGIDRITCPIGERSLGKHPAQIAIGVAAEFLRQQAVSADSAACPPAERTGI